MDGIINIYKEKGFTSHDVVAVVRKTINQKKVGHTGTLDPDAEGVLPVCLGKGTKLADYIMAERKSYRATVTIGITTTTEDASGEILEKRDFVYDEGKIIEAVNLFKGEYMQTPPMYSAIKQQGKKLYELAREGKEVYREPRKISIYDINVTGFYPPDRFEIEVDCSKGTYIRTLCVDIGEKLGCGAHMSELLRTASGKFNIENSITLEQLKNYVAEGKIEEILMSINDVLSDYNKVRILENGTKLLHNGCKIYDYFFGEFEREYKMGETVLVYDWENTFIGLFKVLKDEEKDRICVKPVKMMI